MLLGIPTPGPRFRYWRTIKTNTAGTGNYFNEMKVFFNGNEKTVLPSMITGFALNNFGAGRPERLVDNNTSTQSFHVDSAGIGAWLMIDFGEGNAQSINEWRYYVSGSVRATWDIQCSTDGTTWETVVTGYNCAGGAGWKTITW